MSASAGRSASAVRRVAADLGSRLPWLVDAYRSVRNPRWALDLHRDLRATRANAAFTRSIPPGDAGETALVALYRDNVYETKLALTLATGLRLRGLSPVVSMPTNRTARTRRYAAAFGVDDVIAQDRIEIPAALVAEVDATCRRFLESPLDFEAVREWSFRGVSVGNHVLSTLIRVTFDGSPDLGLETNRELVTSILAEVLRNTVRAEILLDRVAPSVVLVEEANYSVNGPLVDVTVNRGIDVVQTVGLWREDSLMSKRLTKSTRRVDALSVAPETLDRFEHTPLTRQESRELDADFAERYGRRWELGQQYQPDTVAMTGEQIATMLDLDPSKPTAVIFAHVLWDASLFFGVDLFENYADWLVQSVSAARENDRVNWVVKAHPSNVFRAAHGDVGGESSEVLLVREQFPQLPPHVKVLLPETRVSTLSLYEYADYGVTVRGTPGLEIACFGKPAFTAGTGTYAGHGFTYDSRSRHEYLERLASIHDYGRAPAEMTDRARRYAWLYFTRRPWRTRSFDLIFEFAERGWHPVDRNVAFTARSITDVRQMRDLDEWATWATTSSDADFVAETQG